MSDSEAPDHSAAGPGFSDSAEPFDAAPLDSAAAASLASSRRDRSKKRARRKLRRRIIYSVLAVLLAVGAVAGWVGYRLYQAYHELQAAAPLVQDLRHELADGDAAEAQRTLATLQDHSSAAHTAAHDFLWRASARLPIIGPNLDAVSVIADVVDELSWNTLPPLVESATTLDPAQLAPEGGRINVDALASAAPRVLGAADTIKAVTARIDAIDRTDLFASVADAADQLSAKLRDVQPLMATAVRAAKILPPMLGADGPRTYLVAFQNLAEPRATGGIFGAYAVIRIEDGKIDLVGQGSGAGSIGVFDPALPVLTEDEEGLYWDLPARYPQDVNLTPDFPRAAELFRMMYQKRFGGEIDGVLATDPVALAEVLKATGPVELAGLQGLPANAPLPDSGALTGDNAVDYLLAGAYVGTTAEESDQIFAVAAKAVFTALVDGQGDRRGALEALEEAARQRRMLVWSAHDTEQELLAGTVLEGRLPDAAEDAKHPTLGVYFNDGTGGKMGYYLHSDIAVEPAGCQPDGRELWDVTVQLTSDAPDSGLPDYVRGLAMAGDYVTRTNIQLFAPYGGTITGATRDGEEAVLETGTERGRFVGWITLEVAPGATGSITARVVVDPPAAGGRDGVDVDVTPLATPAKVHVGDLGGCGG